MEKIKYYTDPLNDDFAENNIKKREINGDYPFIHNSLIWRAVSFFLYYVIACPIIFLISKVYLGLRVESRKNLRSLKGKGFFMYGNHTRALDAFITPMSAFPHRAYIVANADAVSIKGLGWLVQMLGALPIPTRKTAIPKLMDAIDFRYKQNSCIIIYPEAHIWPFYTGIRPFKSTSFRYPVKLNAPVVAVTTTYRKRKGLFRFCRRPGMTAHISEVMYPDSSLSGKAAQEKLRNQVYSQMCRDSEENENVEYIRYIQKDA